MNGENDDLILTDDQNNLTAEQNFEGCEGKNVEENSCKNEECNKNCEGNQVLENSDCSDDCKNKDENVELEEKCKKLEEKCTELENKCAELESRCTSCEQKCEAYESDINNLHVSIDEKNALISNLNSTIEKYSDYDSIKEQLENANQQIHNRFCQDLKISAINRLTNENVDKKKFDEIISNCENGVYNSEEEMIKDIAVAVYSARLSNRDHFETGIEHQTQSSNLNSKKVGSTAAERIAARCNNNNNKGE